MLDVACGSGRHIRLALERGFRVTGVDRDISSASVLAENRLELVETNLEDGRADPLPPGPFDCVVVTNYLWRPILPAIVAAVGPAGLLIYETFATGNARFGKPKNPDFLARPGELAEAVQGSLFAIKYEHGRLSEPDRIVQRIVAVGPNHEWLISPPNLEKA